MSLRSALSNITLVRKAVRLFVALGDNVRPIVQRPIIKEFIMSEPFERVFDAGCGTGMYTVIVLPKAKHVSALDYSEQSIAKLRTRLAHHKHLDLYQGSATDVPLEDSSFVLILHCEVLEHIQDDRKVLSELYRVCKPGGRMVISVPHPPAPIDDPNHVREGYTREQLTLLLNEAGFQVEKCRYCMFGLSKKLIVFEDKWYNKVHLPLPTIFYIPLYIERWISRDWGTEKQPYDMILQVRKAI